MMSPVTHLGRRVITWGHGQAKGQVPGEDGAASGHEGWRQDGHGVGWNTVGEPGIG